MSPNEIMAQNLALMNTDLAGFAKQCKTLGGTLAEALERSRAPSPVIMEVLCVLMAVVISEGVSDHEQGYAAVVSAIRTHVAQLEITEKIAQASAEVFDAAASA